MDFGGTSEVIFVYCQNKPISLKRMEQKESQVMILKSSENLLNQKILNLK